MSRRMVFMVWADRRSSLLPEPMHVSTCGRNIPGPETNRLKPGVDSALCVMGRPTGNVLEQSDRPNRPVAAEIEPMTRTARYADQIAGVHFDRHHITVLGCDVKQPATLD